MGRSGADITGASGADSNVQGPAGDKRPQRPRGKGRSHRQPEPLLWLGPAKPKHWISLAGTCAVAVGVSVGLSAIGRGLGGIGPGLEKGGKAIGWGLAKMRLLQLFGRS